MLKVGFSGKDFQRTVLCGILQVIFIFIEKNPINKIYSELSILYESIIINRILSINTLAQDGIME